MRSMRNTAAALLIGFGALGLTAAASAEDDNRDRNHREHDAREHNSRGDRDDDHRGDHRRNDRRKGDHRRDDHRYDHRRSDYRNDHRRYAGRRPELCRVDHDHRYHHRDYYSYYPRDRYYSSDPGFSISLNLGNRGYYDRGGSYNNRPYYDQRGYRDAGRVVNRETYRLSGYDARAVLVEEIYPGRRGAELVCTVTARGPDAQYVPYGQLRSIAARECSHRADIRVYA